jgi:DNA-binding transcriptional regulator YiaG
MFEELLGSVREAGAILRGEKSVRVIREKTSLSQSEFAR